MDLQALADLFATTYNADPNIQKAGELQIRKVRAVICSYLFFPLKTSTPVPDRCPGGRDYCSPPNYRI